MAARIVTSLMAAAMAGPVGAAGSCEVSAGARPPAVVELYTSQGCSSCPPADRWLSSLRGQPGVVALAFHVNYWNHLGWADPFATEQTTARQHQLRAALGARYVYTPQVVLNGQDHRGWRSQAVADLRPATPAPATTSAALASVPSLRLVRDGTRVLAHIGALDAAPRLAGYWAVLQDDQRSAVTRGENAGSTLHNDHVVRLYQPVPAWTAAQARQLSLALTMAPGQRVVFVVTEPDGLKPVQAAVLACG